MTGRSEGTVVDGEKSPLLAAALVERLLDPACPPFALIRRRTPGRDADTVDVLLGPVSTAERLTDIALPKGAPEGGRPVADALALVPYRQIRERGFEARDDGTPLVVLHPQEAYEIPLPELERALPAHGVHVEHGGFDVDDDTYAGIVDRVIEDEIGRGEGANFVIRRTFRG